MIIISYGDKVNCKNYGTGVVVRKKIPCYPGTHRREVLKEEEKLKGFLVRSELILVRFDFDHSTMRYNRDGQRVVESTDRKEVATLSKI
ncbi:MAG: hypothetical protein GY849_09970 [Deltaproteobacteria bacterium]|nr:hypothetical protein [Deltaproteobacteria bacterium]